MGIGLGGLGNLLGAGLGYQQQQLQQYAWTSGTAAAQEYRVDLGAYSPYVPPRSKTFGDEFGPLAREGDIESPLQWLDRRVNEMRVRL